MLYVVELLPWLASFTHFDEKCGVYSALKSPIAKERNSEFDANEVACNTMMCIAWKKVEG